MLFVTQVFSGTSEMHSCETHTMEAQYEFSKSFLFFCAMFSFTFAGICIGIRCSLSLFLSECVYLPVTKTQIKGYYFACVNSDTIYACMSCVSHHENFSSLLSLWGY